MFNTFLKSELNKKGSLPLVSEPAEELRTTRLTTLTLWSKGSYTVV